MLSYLIALACVVGMAAGQILFKISARGLHETGTLLSLKSAGALCAALFLYGLTSVAWVWVLQRMDLGKVYPIMALAFVFVPLASYFIFGERFAPQYILGVCFIFFGVVMAVNS